MAQALLDRHGGAAHMAKVERRGRPQQLSDRRHQALRVVGGLGRLERDPAQLGRQRRRAVAVAVLGGEPIVQVLRGAAIAVVLEQAREQLVGRLAGVEIEPLLLVAREHQPRLELEQRSDQHEELGGGFQVQLTRALQVLDVGEHDVREVDLEQVDLLPEDQRQEQVEGSVEDLEIEVERGDRHAVRLDPPSDVDVYR